ncbi:hypothetical protein J4401_03060 [Candidatus Woesearchaeota archaeon]|nr:hypothetical protein [Candidatus Woesearchaeota archaeon]
MELNAILVTLAASGFLLVMGLVILFIMALKVLQVLEDIVKALVGLLVFGFIAILMTGIGATILLH